MLDQLKKWLLGESDWKSEQDLGQQAKKDAFLADALEGYRSLPEADHAKAIQNLKDQLQKRRKKRSVIIPWKTITGVAAGIAALSILLWLQRDIRVDHSMAESTEPVERKGKEEEKIDDLSFALDEVQDSDSNSPTEERPIDPDQQKDLEKPIAATETPKAKVEPGNIEAGIMDQDDLTESEVIAGADLNAASDGATLSKPSVEILDEVVTSEEVVIEESENPPVLPDADADVAIKEEAQLEPNDLEVEKDQIAAAKRRMDTAPLSQVSAPAASIQQSVQGRIRDLNTIEPLIGANVVIKETGEGAVSDFDGNFNLSSAQAFPWTLEISYTGYTVEQVIVENPADNFLIEMDASSVVLEEVQVTGYNVKKRSKASVSKAQPRNPKAYERYIEKNLRYPLVARENSIKGLVKLSFYIGDDGRPLRIKIDQSLGYGCDAEAIRLIKNGPKWKPVGAWATYDIRFQL